MAIEEKISNSGATVKAAEDLQETTDEVNASKVEVLSDPNLIEAKPSGAHALVEIPDSVQEAGVIEVLEPHNEMLSGSAVHAGSVDGSGIALPPKKQRIVTELFKSRTHIPGPVENTSTWRHVTQTKNKILGLFRKLPKAA